MSVHVQVYVHVYMYTSCTSTGLHTEPRVQEKVLLLGVLSVWHWCVVRRAPDQRVALRQVPRCKARGHNDPFLELGDPGTTHLAMIHNTARSAMLHTALSSKQSTQVSHSFPAQSHTCIFIAHMVPDTRAMSCNASNTMSHSPSTPTPTQCHAVGPRHHNSSTPQQLHAPTPD